MGRSNNENCKRYRHKKKFNEMLLSVPFALRRVLRLRPKWTEKEREEKEKIIEEMTQARYNLACRVPDFRLADEVLATVDGQADFDGLFYALVFRGLQLQLLPPYAKIFCKRLETPDECKAIFKRLMEISAVSFFVPLQKDFAKIENMIKGAFKL